MADKRLDQVSQLTDFDYALIVKGEEVAKLSRQDFFEMAGEFLYGAKNAETLASVVAGLLPADTIKALVGVQIIYVYYGDTYDGLPDGLYTIFKSYVGEIAINYYGVLFFRKFTDGTTTGWYKVDGTKLV